MARGGSAPGHERAARGMGALRRALARGAPAAGLAAGLVLLSPAGPVLAQTGVPACPADERVASDWALKPSGMRAGDRFRLLFITSTGRTAASADIGVYNDFVQARAAAGHTAVRGFGPGFRAVAATAAASARDNTCTTYTSTDKGVPVHWLNGNKVADDSADFYDGAWDDETGRRDESGARASATRVWTGAAGDGTADAGYELGSRAPAIGELDTAEAGPLHHPELAGKRSSAYPLYGLSQVFRVTATGRPARATTVRLASSPKRGSTYGAQETITVRLTMNEPVRVSGRPHVWLEVGTARRKASYAGATGEAVTALDFSYAVQPGDADTDGVGLCAPARHAQCGKIHLDGGSILAVSDATVAAPAHPALGAQKGHGVSARGARHPVVEETAPAHCDPSDDRELWCATMTVGARSDRRGYERSGGYGALAPDRFSWRGATLAVSELWRGASSLRFAFTVTSGVVPSGGLLGARTYALEVGTGAGAVAPKIRNPGTGTSFSVSGAGVSWESGERVAVRLVLAGAVPTATAASLVSSPAGGTTYKAGETITARLTMDEAVLVTGRPYLWLSVGGARRKAVHDGPVGTATTTLDFDYVVRSGDYDRAGVGLCEAERPGCGRIHLDGGSIREESDESAADLEHPALGGQSGHRVDAAPLALSPPTACTDEILVADDWALAPSGLEAGDRFRLLFVTSTGRNARSSKIADYNGFVQGRARAGHAAVRPFGSGFRVVGSTASVDARDNTCTTYTSTDKGEPIYWLNGAKVADDYEDFYDDSWDNVSAPRKENGVNSGLVNVWTGSSPDGTGYDEDGDGMAVDYTLGSSTFVGYGLAGMRAFSPFYIDATTNDKFYNLYGLSQVFKVREDTDTAITATAVSLISSPKSGNYHLRGETLEVEVTFSGAVVVRGVPLVNLWIGRPEGADRRFDATYASGSGTDKLVFALTVPSGLKDGDGIEVQIPWLSTPGASIVSAADGFTATWETEVGATTNLGGKVDSTLAPPTGGVCARTPAVRDALVAALGFDDCSQVTAASLAGLTSLEVEGLTALRPGDLAGLRALETLELLGSGIETLPVGLFDGLDRLKTLKVRVGLTHLPRDIFRGLDTVTFLNLNGEAIDDPGNRLRAGGLPDGVFEPLSRELGGLWVFGSPGSDGFRPRAADAGPGGTVSAGETVTLGGAGNDGGIWGTNFAWEWRQHDGAGEPASIVTLSATDTARPSFTAPVRSVDTAVKLALRLDGAGTADGAGTGDASKMVEFHSPWSEAVFTIRGLAPTGVAVVSRPIAGSTYRRGETVEVGVTFADRVLVERSRGTPTLALTVGAATRRAAYVRGSGTARLVFAYAVQAGDADTDGIEVAANALALDGAAIVSLYGAAAPLGHDALAMQGAHKVDGAATHGYDLTAGICARTAPLRDKLVDLVNDVPGNGAVTNCSLVTGAHLAALRGTLDVSGEDIGTLKPGDFAGLGAVVEVDLSGNALAGLAPGAFAGLGAALTRLDLSDNAHASLPARVFEALTGLSALDLSGNPGAAGFAPAAVAGPAGGVEAVSGETVALGVAGAQDGLADPWGANVTRAWTRRSGRGGALADTAGARASFTAPVAGEDTAHAFRVTVTGRGGRFEASDEVAVRVAAGPRVERVSFATAPASAGGPAYTAGATVEVALELDRAVAVDTTGGVPALALAVGTARRSAAYLRGSGTRVLVFGYAVAASDSDTDGVDVVADSLALNGGTLLGVSDGGAAALGHAALAGGVGRPVSGSGAPVALGGICARTAAVRAAILERVRAAESALALGCGDVTLAHLVAITGWLDVSRQASSGRMTALGEDDFAWLSNVTGLDLDRHALRTLPARVFHGLPSLRHLSIAYNQTQAEDRMTTLPAGVFDTPAKLATLRLEHNDLETLPDGIFAKQTALATLTLGGNPGSARFVPVAVAGPESGLDAQSGDTVTLGTGADPGGPWGANLVYAWRQVSGPAVALSDANAARPRFTAPAVATAAVLEFELSATGRGTRVTATDRVTVRVAPGTVLTSLALVSGPVSGETYRRGETIAVAAAFAKPVTVTGTPRLALSVGSGTREAVYARGSGTRTLVFEYRVARGDRDPDGIAVAANAVALAGATIADAGAMAAVLDHGALAAQPGHKVDGSVAGLTGGICARTPAVRDVVLVRVRAHTASPALGCHQVDAARLGALTGTLHLRDRGLRTLKAGDFAGLGGIVAVDLSDNALAGLPAGAFGGLDATLTRLDLSDNDLVVLPARLLEDLTGLAALDLSGNPGRRRFAPLARAGDAIAVARGARVTLGAEGAERGHDDPWGTNVTWTWEKTAGAAVTYESGKGLDTARPAFTAPAGDGRLDFRLTVAGRGGRFEASDTVSVQVGSDGVPPGLESAVANGATLTLTYDEEVKTTRPVPASGKGPVYVAVLGTAGAGRSVSTARVGAAAARGRTVVMTLDPPAEHRRTVTLSYRPDNATAASRVQDPDGHPAGAFTGLRVRNDTPQGPHVREVVFAGPAGVYAIADTVAVDVVFSEPVAVTGRPTLALALGATARTAHWKAGQGAGATHRFEYTVVEGDAAPGGIAVAASGLAAPAGSAIVTVAGGEAVRLHHGALTDPARAVDGVRPTARSARSEGPSVRVIWSEPLDAGAAPAGAGGFTVDVAGGADPAVTAVVVAGAVATLVLDAPIALGTPGVTVRYAPASSPLRDAAGNAAAAFPSPLAVEVAADETAPVLAAAVVDGDRLTLTYDEPLEVARPAKSGASEVFTVAVSGGGAFTLSDIRAGVGAGNTQVAMTLAPPARAGQAVTVAYAAGSATAASRVQDLAGNEAASFTATTALAPAVAVENRTGVPALTLSKAQVTEGDDAQVVLTLSTGGTAYALERTFTLTVESGATAVETEDWTLSAARVALAAGAREATATLTIVDDARLEGEETVGFKASLGAAETAPAALAIADDDRAVLVVTGPPGPVTEGDAFDLELRLEPHPDNLADVSTVAGDACIVDFPVTAVLAVSGDTASALPDGAALETVHDFAATSFTDCVREAVLGVPTRASDGVWAADRALAFALTPQSGSDPRVEAGAALAVTVRDDTPGGPLVTGITVSPVPPQASAQALPVESREAFVALPDAAVHGPGAALAFTLAFDQAVTVRLDPRTQARPALALDVYGRERRARYTGPVGRPTTTLRFAWTVARGDYDPDGLEVRGIVLNGATLRDSQGRDMPPDRFPAQAFAEHRVRGGFFAMRMEVARSAREGEPVTVRVVRDGGAGEVAHAIVAATDSGVVDGRTGQPRVWLLSVPLESEGAADDWDGDWRHGLGYLVVAGDGRSDASRTLTFRLVDTDLGGPVPTWYDAREPLRVTVPVTDTGLAADAPQLSVGWAEAREEVGAKLLFEVRLAPQAPGEVRVDYATRDVSATAGADYVATRGTLVFAPGEVRKAVAVAVLADSHDEGAETLMLVLSNPRGAVIVAARGEGVGTIRNRGPLQKAWVGRFGRTVAEQVLDAVEDRMGASSAPGGEVTLAGERVGWSVDGGAADAAARAEEARRAADRLAGWVGGEGAAAGLGSGDAWEGRVVTRRELLTGASFAVSGEWTGAGRVSLWGRGATSGFEGREGALALDGEVSSVMLGADWASGPSPGAGFGSGGAREAGAWTAGLVLSHSVGAGAYRGEGPGGRVEAEMTGLFPWGRYTLGDGVQVWGAAGSGRGALTVIPGRADDEAQAPRSGSGGGDGAALRAGLDLWMAAGGLRRTVVDGGEDGLTLTGKTDAMVVRTGSGRARGADGGRLEPARARVSRLRVALAASRPVALGGGAVLTPGLAAAVRHDGGDAETGFGLDLGGGLTLSMPAHGLAAELRGRGLLSHESKGFRDRGLSGALAWRQRSDSERGAKLTLAHTLGGASSGGADSLLSRATLDGLAGGAGADDAGAAAEDDLRARRLELGLGYGVPAFGERFTSTPEVGVELADTGRSYRLGWRLAGPASPGLAFDFGAEAIRREPAGSAGGAEHEVGVGFGWRLDNAGRPVEARVEARRRRSASRDASPEHEVGFRLTARF